MTSSWEPYREPLRVTLMRTGTIALVIGAMLALSRGSLARWPMATLLVLWPALGGHWLEVWFLNWLRPRLPSTRIPQIFARLGTWFIGGAVLAIAMIITETAISGLHRLPWSISWVGGIAFIVVELIAHLALRFRGRPNFYNGRG